MDTEQLHEALRRAVALADNNQSKFAKGIGASQQIVSYWLAKGRPLPGEYVLRAEAAGFGSRHDLRPDLYPRASPAICSLCEKRAEDPHVQSCTLVDCPCRAREAA